MMWWVFHVSALFLRIKFPLRARSLDKSRKFKYAHLTTVITAIVLPLISAIVVGHSGHGYSLTRFPPFFCTGSDANSTFYALILPIDIGLGTGVTMLIYIFWIIHKVRY